MRRRLQIKCATIGHDGEAELCALTSEHRPFLEHGSVWDIEEKKDVMEVMVVFKFLTIIKVAVLIPDSDL